MFIHLFNTFGAPSPYKIQGKSYDKNISNSTAITGHKNAANVTPQRKHTEKHTVYTSGNILIHKTLANERTGALKA